MRFKSIIIVKRDQILTQASSIKTFYAILSIAHLICYRFRLLNFIIQFLLRSFATNYVRRNRYDTCSCFSSVLEVSPGVATAA
jgi:hypothetical protein